jgi:hypothetical protein
MLPRPTADPTAARTNPVRLDQCSRAAPAMRSPPLLVGRWNQAAQAGAPVDEGDSALRAYPNPGAGAARFRGENAAP